MQRVLIVLAVVVALMAAIFLAVRYVGQQRQDVSQDTVATTEDTGTTDTAATSTGPATIVPEPAAPYFAFRRLEVQTSGDEPEACLVFTRKLDSSGKTKYEDYLKLDPDAKFALRVSQDRLCVSGLAFGQTYQLELKVGLPALTNDKGETEKLTKAETLPVELRDKPALVRFGNGLVLPRGIAQGVPITTVNVAKLDVKVLRVGDRLLSQLQTGIVDQREFYEYERNNLENEQGQVVWTGQLTVPNNRRNDEAITLFPLREALKDKIAGAYLIVATDSLDKSSTDENSYWKAKSAQFVIDTNLGLTTFKGKDGLNVFVRSLKSAEPLSGVTVALVARNNEELQRVRTDGDGRAAFSAAMTRGTGGMEPVVVMAYGSGNDFAFLDLRRPAFDLTDRGVEGRSSPDLIDAYLYTERGIYRPGETVNVTTLLRDHQTRAMADDTQLHYILSRPDGLQAKKWTASKLQSGGATTPVPLTATAPRGRWQVAAYVDPKGDPIGRVAFDVQDFVPQKLKVELKAAQKTLRPGTTATIDVTGRFLYGAPAAGLGGEGTLTITTDSTPFADVAALKHFRFGKVDETFEGTQVTMTVPATDASGKTQATAAIEQLPQTSLPLKANITIAIYEPGGRTTSDQISLPLRTADTLIGVRPAFDGDSIQENLPASFEVLAVDADGKPKAASITWELVNEDIDYRWYQVDNAWKYERVVNDRIVEGGKADLEAGKAFKLSKALAWGSYRLTVIDPASGAATAYRFWSGWGSGAGNDRPDRVAVAADKPVYASGETAKIAISPPSNGKALVVIASNKIHYTKLVDVQASGSTISIPVSSEWGSGAYALVTHYRPLSSDQKRAPVRSIGVAWIGVDPAPRTLKVALKAPTKVTPNNKLSIPVEVTNLSWGEAVYVTLAAVDEGILQLTDFESPDPAKHYFGKRRLGLDMRDDYGRLISAENAIVGQIRTGGDAVGGRSLAVVPQKTVSLFSGLVALNGGKGSITLDIPDFNGELRLMAVAYSGGKLGRAEQPLTVRDPVVAEVVLPRFLAPGDKITAALNMHNVEGAPGQYTATVKSTGVAANPAGDTRVATTLSAGERKLLAVPVYAGNAGIGTIALHVDGPGGFKLDRDWQIEVREPQLPVSSEDVAIVGPGRDAKFGKELLAAFKPGTAQVAVTVTGNRGFDDVPGLLRWLDRYPYGCLEQTTSRAFPLVHYNDMALLANVKQDKTIKDRVQDAANRVLDMQTYGGSFGMWSSISGEADTYIGMFAIDFLSQAKQKGYVIPEEGIERALTWARKAAGSESNTDLARAYGFYLLAEAGSLSPSELRYFADTRIEGMTNPFALGLMGTALSQIGDRARAMPAFRKARDLVNGANLQTYVSDTTYYGTLLRDVAGLTAMSAKAGRADLMPALVARVSSFDPRLNYTTTQEKAWMLLAAHEVEEATPPVNVAVTGTTVAQKGKVLRFSPTLAQMDKSISLKNNGQKDVWRIVSAEGIPASPLAAEQRGVTLSKAILTMSGTPASLSNVKQNDRFIVRLSGEMGDNRARLMALLDLLPSGFEIEGMVQRKDDGSTMYPFLPVLAQANIAEARDDRFVVTFDIGSGYQGTTAATAARPTFHFAYIVRATVPGSYVVPAGVIEDMYSPEIRARTNMGQMTIAAN